MAMRKLGIGLVGGGFIGGFHARAYQALHGAFPELDADARITIVVDVSAQAAETFAARYGIPRWTTDWRALLDDPEVQIVDICTPPALHREIGLAAAGAGKHVFSEKPVGLNASETAELADAVRRAGVASFVGFNYRWIPAVVYARDLIAQGEIGDVVTIRVTKDSDSAADLRRPWSWRFDAAQAGFGSLADVGSHVFDMARCLNGEITELSGHTRTIIPERYLDGELQPVTNDDYWMAHATFENGATGIFQGSRVATGRKADMEFEVVGTGGALRWDMRIMNELAIHQPRTDGRDGYTAVRLGPEHPYHGAIVPVRGHAIGFTDTFTIEMYEFIRGLVEDRPTAPTFDDALAVARILEAVPQRRWVSLATGTPAGTRDSQ